jgi:hypothetical protein
MNDTWIVLLGAALPLIPEKLITKNKKLVESRTKRGDILLVPIFSLLSSTEYPNDGTYRK